MNKLIKITDMSGRYIRNYFMPTHGFKMAENGAQEMEVFDTAAHTTGYAYMPVMRK